MIPQYIQWTSLTLLYVAFDMEYFIGLKRVKKRNTEQKSEYGRSVHALYDRGRGRSTLTF